MKIDDILKQLCIDFGNAKTLPQRKAEIKKAFLDVIGEDEEYQTASVGTARPKASNSHRRRSARNELRRQIRNRLEKLFEEKKC